MTRAGNMGNSVVRVLLAEDSAFSVRDLRRKLTGWGVDHEVTVANDGQEAIEMLDPSSEAGRLKRPDVLLLDLNMPRVPGHEVLSFVRAQPCYAALPVAVLTESDSPHDIDLAYSLNVDEYVMKGSSASEMHAVLDRLLDLSDLEDFEDGMDFDAYRLEGDFDDDRLHELTNR